MTPSKTQLLVCAASVALCACTMIPTYHRPPAPVASVFPGSSGSVIVQAARGTKAPDLRWREFFRDERLAQLIELALTHNRDLRVAMLNVQKSRAEYRVTRASSFPAIETNETFTREHLTGGAITPGAPTSISFTGNEWSANVGVSAYEVDLFGRVRSLNKQALEEYFASAEAQRSAQIALVAELGTQYFTWREAQEELQVARETLQAVQESYDLNRASFDAGQTGELDLRTAEGQVQNAQTNVAMYERQTAQARNALVLLVGQELPQDLPAARPFPGPDLLAEVPAGLPSDLMERRPDILQAEHTLKAANANIGAARAAFFPAITLTGSIGTASMDLTKLFGPGSGQWSYMPQITLPIFTGGKNRASLDSAKVSARIEVANYEKSIQTAFREVSDALVAHSTYIRQARLDAAAVGTQRRRLDLAEARYRQGEDSYLNVLLAQQDLYGVQQARLSAEFNTLFSQITLYRALGGGWK